MIAVIQRVSGASVSVDGETVGRIGRGFLILLGVKQGDSEKQAEILAKKCAGLRIFDDQNGKMNISPKDVNAEMLVVSNFTLSADCSHGFRPSFSNAVRSEDAIRLYEYFIKLIKDSGLNVATGRFGAHMRLDISADGPVTIPIDTDNL